MAATKNLTRKELLDRIALLESSLKALDDENKRLLLDLTAKRAADPVASAPPPPDDYEPPRDLVGARNAARHFRTAAIMHLATIEDQRREIAALRAKLRGTRGKPSAYVKSLENGLELVTAENQRLKTELQHATTAWRDYQGPAQAAKHLYHFARWAIPQLAQHTGPGKPLQGGRMVAPVVG